MAARATVLESLLAAGLHCAIIKDGDGVRDHLVDPATNQNSVFYISTNQNTVLTSPGHHGEDAGVCDDSGADLGLDKVGGHTVARE